MKSLYLSLLILACTFTNLLAQQIKITGTIKDTSGQPVSFASVYIKNTSKGTSANIDGAYSINVDKGTVILSFRAVGYKTSETTLNTDANAVQDVTLNPEAYTLQGVTIAANAEDPAFEIIRQAIKNRRTHLTEINEFSCGVYIKGLQKLVGAPKRFFGRDIQKTLDLDTNRKGILYLSESQSNYNYKRPNRIREEMISSKIAGRNNAFSFNKASDLDVNFYNNIMLENTLSSRGFVSPIAENAMLYYRYKLLGMSIENGQTVNKIQVIPRREHDPVFRGIIYITDDSWRIYGTNLYLTKNTGVNLIDTLNIEQQFIKVDNSYVPSNINFKFNGDVFGFKFEGYYLGVYNNYNLQPNFPDDFFNGEILNVPKSVNSKDSLYWVNNRPIPLTQEEKINYIKKDSVAKRKESKYYLDSLERVNNKYTVGKLLLTGYSINNHFEKNYLRFDPVLKALFYNTVEGFGFRYGVTYRKDLGNRKEYTIRPEVRYGFSNQTLTANLQTNFYYDPIKQANVSLNFGSGIYDLNRYGTMSLRANALNSLLFEKNFSKFYKKHFINAGTTRELATGLQAAANLEYSKTFNLENATTFKFFDYKDREFTSNNPFQPLNETPLFPDYKALTFNATLTYNIGQTYITRPDGKFYQPSKYPQLELNYRKGINNVLGSDVDYDLISFELFQERISAGLWGYFSFVAGAGKFLNNNTVYYPDSKHFRGNNSLTALPDLRKFQFLDFYQYSTDRHYFEAHLEHNFAGLLTNKIPLLRKLKLEELLGGNYLTQPLKKNYKEYYFGLQRLIFRATYGFAFDGSKQVQHGFRISYGF
jgi:hypothetical protein